MKQKRCTELQIPHCNSQRLEHIKQYRRMITHRASDSVYCTTKTKRFESSDYYEQWADTADSKIFESAHHCRIESERPIRIRIESRSFAGP